MRLIAFCLFFAFFVAGVSAECSTTEQGDAWCSGTNSYLQVDYSPSAKYSFDSRHRSLTITLQPKDDANVLFGDSEIFDAGTDANPAWQPMPSCFEELESNNYHDGIRMNVAYKPLCQSCGGNYVIKTDFGLAGQPDFRGHFTAALKIPCSADVAIVTVGRSKLDKTSRVRINSEYFGFEEALLTYVEHLSSLSNSSMTVRYVELDNNAAITSFGYSFPQSFGMNSAAASSSLVKPVRKVLKKTGSDYLIIMGGVSVVPMPWRADSAGEDGMQYFQSVDGRVPSDDAYSMTAKNKEPSVVVSRFPTPVSDDPSSSSAAIITMVSAVYSEAPSFSNTVIVSDACNVLGPEDCTLEHLADSVLNGMFAFGPSTKYCSSDSMCELAPDFCYEIHPDRGAVFPNCRGDSILNELFAKDGIVFITHGDGRHVLAENTLNGDQYRILDADHLLERVESGDFLENRPLVFFNCAYCGAVDGYLHTDSHGELAFTRSASYGSSLVLGFAAAGARAIVGRTRVGFDESSSVAAALSGGPLYPKMIGDFYRGSEPLGRVFLEMKQSAYAAGAAEGDRRFADVETLVLYGDPFQVPVS